MWFPKNVVSGELGCASHPERGDFDLPLGDPLRPCGNRVWQLLSTNGQMRFLPIYQLPGTNRRFLSDHPMMELPYPAPFIPRSKGLTPFTPIDPILIRLWLIADFPIANCWFSRQLNEFFWISSCPLWSARSGFPSMFLCGRILSLPPRLHAGCSGLAFDLRFASPLTAEC